MNDLLLKGGTVLDPSQNIKAKLDVAVKNGVISQLAPTINPAGASRVMEVAGKLVVPGLIDLHCHVYEGVNDLSINPDLVGVKSGVTTLVDAGSAGSYTFGGFPKYIVPQAKSRVFCMLNIARTKDFEPEISNREDIDLEHTVKVILANKPLIQGVKLRAIGPGATNLGVELVRLAKRAATAGGVSLMIHIGETNPGTWAVLTRELLPLMEPGDILTHLFCDLPGRILDENGKVIPELMDAQERGVFLDTAHGRDMFSFAVARRALDQGVRPNSISTDVTLSGRQTAFISMTEILSRFIALGFSLEDVIRMTTTNPARALGMENNLGSLKIGNEADISILEEVSGDWIFRDMSGGSLRGTKAVIPIATVKAGEVFSPDWGPRPWGWLPESTS